MKILFQKRLLLFFKKMFFEDFSLVTENEESKILNEYRAIQSAIIRSRNSLLMGFT